MFQGGSTSWTGYYNVHNVCTKQKVRWGCGSTYSFRMAEGNKKRFSPGEVFEEIFNNEDIDCGCDMEMCPDSENEENSDIGI